MKGLVYKELKLLWDCWHLWPVLLIAPMLVFLLEMFKGGVILCLLVSILPLAVFYQEEQYRWERYAVTLPLSPGMIVSARYLVTLALVLGCAAFCFALGCFQCRQRGVMDTRALWKGTRLVLSLSVMVPALCYPAMYRWGFLRGGMVDAAVIAVFLGLSALWRQNMQITLANLYFWTQPVLFSVSWWLSIRWYQKREFS